MLQASRCVSRAKSAVWASLHSKSSCAKLCLPWRPSRNAVWHRIQFVCFYTVQCQSLCATPIFATSLNTLFPWLRTCFSDFALGSLQPMQIRTLWSLSTLGKFSSAFLGKFSSAFLVLGLPQGKTSQQLKNTQNVFVTWARRRTVVRVLLVSLLVWIIA